MPYINPQSGYLHNFKNENPFSRNPYILSELYRTDDTRKKADENLLQITKSTLKMEKPKNLTSILYSLSSASNNDLIPQIWKDKLTISRLKISSLLTALAYRKKLLRDSIYNIDNDICSLHTQQFALQDSSSLGKYSINPAQSGLEKSVVNLESEKRTQRSAFWKDATSIQEDLVNAISDYISLKRKMNLLGINSNNKEND
ncbi:hypothetical protein BVY01_00685 [bacterium I07]|nr:hypothetical protein BVY01_00685 [bacterium I07]